MAISNVNTAAAIGLGGASSKNKQDSGASFAAMLSENLAEGKTRSLAQPKEGEGVKNFSDYMNKTPEDRLFDAFLRQMGMTREQFESLDIKEQKKILAKFEDLMKLKNERTVEEMKKKTDAGELI